MPESIRDRRAGLVILIAISLLAVAVAAGAAPKGEKVDFTLTVLHHNDGESDLLEDDAGAGSISRFGWLVDNLGNQALRGPSKARGKSGVIAISAGDNFLAGPELQASFSKGIPYYDAIALDHLDYDAFTIGNHEFDFGPEVLADFINSFTGNDDIFISANLDFSAVPSLQALVDEGRIRPSVVVKERGERIGIIGLTTPELAEVTSPGATVVDDDLAGVVQAEVDRLTADGIDKIILSSHLQAITNELALVGEISGVDAVVGGGGGEDLSGNYPLTATDSTGRLVPVVTVPGDYFDVGRLVLEFDRDGNVISFGGGLEPVSGDLPQDQFILMQVEQPVAAFLETLAATVVAQTEVGLNGIRADVRTRETNLGNLLADAHLAAAQARAASFGVPVPDVAFQNGGGIRNDSIIPAGDVTLLDTFDIAPFSNFISVIPDVSRDDLKTAVEHGLSGLPAQAGSFAQWSGLTITYDPAQAPGSRVVSIALDDGTPIVAAGSVVAGDPLSIATIDFLANGNDGYDVFETYDFTTLGISYQQSLADFISDLGVISAADYADPVSPADRTRIIPLG